MKDYSYQTFFAKEDLPHLKAMVREVNRTHDVSIIGEYNEMCEMQVQGYRGVGMTFDGYRLIPQDTIKSDDLVCLPGLNRALDIIIGASSARYRYMGLGNAGSDVTPTTADTGLVAEAGIPRIDMNNSELGWIEPEGMHMLFGAIMGETTSITVSEIAIFTQSGPGVMFNHNIFYPRRLNKTNLQFALFFSSVIEMVPKATGF